MFSIPIMSILITDETNICIVEFNYYAENYTVETNFSHVISAERYTDAASWIVQLSSDSPDINITLDPNLVTMNTQTPTSSLKVSMKTNTLNNMLTPTLSASKVYTKTETSINTLASLSASKVITTSAASSCESTLQQLGIYIGAALFALFLLTLIICIVAISFCCVFHKRKVLQVDVDSYPMHPNTYINDSYSDMHHYRKGSLPSLPDNEIYAKIEEEYVEMKGFK